MSEPDNFLSRWARRKSEAQVLSSPAPEADCSRGDSGDVAGPDPKEHDPETPDLEKLELESLPSVESITATTDISGFLRSGVPAELTRNALRQAWTRDPAIRDFIGIAEN